MTLIKPTWHIPLSLLALGLLNIASGALQVTSIIGGPDGAMASEMTSPHYFTHPWPVLIHIIGGIIFNLLAPFQFIPALRRGGFHRWSGRILWLTGMAAALSGLWMNQFFPAFGTGLKYAIVWGMGGIMAVALVLALRAILIRDIARHRAWMIRAVAMGLAPAVQRVLILPYFFAFGIPDILVIEGVMLASLIINLAVAEWAIRRKNPHFSGAIPAA